MDTFFIKKHLFGQINSSGPLVPGALIKLSGKSGFFKVETVNFTNLEKLGINVLDTLMVSDLEKSEIQILTLDDNFDTEISVYYSDPKLVKLLNLGDLLKANVVEASSKLHPTFGQYYDTGIDISDYVARIKKQAFSGGFGEGVVLQSLSTRSIIAFYLHALNPSNSGIGWTYAWNKQNILKTNKVGKSYIQKAIIYGNGYTEPVARNSFVNTVNTYLNNNSYVLIGEIV